MTTTPREHSAALAELLDHYGFRRHSLARNRLGHFQLAGQLGERPLDILLDTGAASTVVDLGYCSSQGIATRDTGPAWRRRGWRDIAHPCFGRRGFDPGRIAPPLGRHLCC